RWATWTLPLGWPSQGIFPPGSDGTDVNAVCRSPDGSVLATGDDFGTVKLFRYPCVARAATAKSYRGHSSHVTGVVFARAGGEKRVLLSTGGNDRTLLHW
ncbi:unnamed protein product, partial [Phaeothamnion confervicola]